MGEVYLLGDHLNSLTIVASSAFTLQSERRYFAWGEMTIVSGTATNNTFAFTDQRREKDIDLLFYQSRWYDNTLGRFTTPDTIIPQPYDPPSYDRYMYVRNSPPNFNDPTGHDVGCTGQSAENCASKTAVIIACGQGETCGANTKLMQPYYQDAVLKGFQVYFYNNSDFNPAQNQRATNKLDMATSISERVTNNPGNSFILEGHSAGADSVIEANYLSGYSDNINGNVLLEPSMNITLKDGTTPSLQSVADKIQSDKLALASSMDSPGRITINGVKDTNFPGLNYSDLATSQKVIFWLSNNFSWFI